MGIVWEFFQPLLFGLIGAEVSIEYIQDGKLVGEYSSTYRKKSKLLHAKTTWSITDFFNIRYCVLHHFE